MKKRILFVMALIAAAGSVALLVPDFVQSGNVHTVEMSVSRLTCGSCVENIRKTVSVLNGIDGVETDVKNARSIVVFNSEKINADNIATAITNAGYPATILCVTDNKGTQISGVDTDRYVAKIGSRMIMRDHLQQEIEKKIQTAELAGQPIGIRQIYQDVWMSLLRQELLLNAADQFNVSIDDPSLEARAEELRLSTSVELDLLRDEMRVARFLSLQYPDREPSSFEMSNLLNGLNARTPIDIFDGNLKRYLSAGQGRGGCGGSCCG